VFGGAAGNEGLGLFAISLDWAYVGSGGGSIGSLFTPLATQLSLYAGVVVCCVAFCACYARNTWHAQNFPFLTQLLFFENGTEYNQLSILNDDFTLNKDKLAAAGLPYYAASQLLFKVSRTMYIGAAFTHFLLWYSPTVYNIIKRARVEETDDVHYRLMKRYKYVQLREWSTCTTNKLVLREVPWYWYMGLFGACFAVALGTIYGAHSQMPWWALIVALLFAALFIPVIGTVRRFA
jgi:hypothetical protein